MKKFKSLFANVIYTKTVIAKNDIEDENFHVYRKDSYFSAWYFTTKYPTLSAAREYAKSRGESVIYMGEYENGHKKGVTDWEDEPLKHSPEQVLELRRKSYEGYKPELNREDGSPVEAPKFVKAALNQEMEVPVQVENKFVRRLSKG